MSDINDKLAGLNSARDFASASGLSASAIDLLKGGVLDERMRLAAVDPYAAMIPARDFAGSNGATASAVDALKSFYGLDESLRLAGTAGRNSIADPYGALNSARDFAGGSGAMASAVDALESVHGFDQSMRLAGAAGRSSIADPHGALKSARDFAGGSGAMVSSVDALESVHGFDQSMRLADAAGRNSITDPHGAINSTRDFGGGGVATASAVDALKSFHGFDESMRLASAASVDPAMSKIARQISDQRDAIASLRPLIPDMPGWPAVPQLVAPAELHIPPNPLLETNKRLASIEQRFNRMESIALDGAEIATNLQASAATFLIKFEKASANNDRTSGRAVWLGIAAILIAVATTGVQILYTELWRAPADSASQQAAITDMKSQIKDLQSTQRAAADELAKVLSSGNTDVAATLHDIRDLLVEQQRRSVVIPETKP